MREQFFTIITVGLNCEKYLHQTILSVLNQSYKKFKYLFIDGGSIDNTLQIIKKYEMQCPDRFFHISEQDQGIYDAMNKGLALIEDMESYIIFLNSDDYFYNNSILETIALNADDHDFIYGKVELVKNNKRISFGYKFNRWKLLRRNICHQAIFAKRKLFDETGFFDLNYKLVSDYDFVMKVFKVRNIKICFVPIIVSSVRTNGLSSKNILLGRKEYVKILLKLIQPKDFGLYIMAIFFFIPRVWILNIIFHFNLERFRRKAKHFFYNI